MWKFEKKTDNSPATQLYVCNCTFNSTFPCSFFSSFYSNSAWIFKCMCYAVEKLILMKFAPCQRETTEKNVTNHRSGNEMHAGWWWSCRWWCQMKCVVFWLQQNRRLIRPRAFLQHPIPFYLTGRCMWLHNQNFYIYFVCCFCDCFQFIWNKTKRNIMICFPGLKMIGL